METLIMFKILEEEYQIREVEGKANSLWDVIIFR